MNTTLDLTLDLVAELCLVEALILIHWCNNWRDDSLDHIISAHYASTSFSFFAFAIRIA